MDGVALYKHGGGVKLMRDIMANVREHVKGRKGCCVIQTEETFKHKNQDRAITRKPTQRRQTHEHAHLPNKSQTKISTM